MKALGKASLSRLAYKLSLYGLRAALLSRTHEYATVTSRECAFNEAEITRLLSSLWVVKLGTSRPSSIRVAYVAVAVAIVATPPSSSPSRRCRDIKDEFSMASIRARKEDPRNVEPTTNRCFFTYWVINQPQCSTFILIDDLFFFFIPEYSYDVMRC